MPSLSPNIGAQLWDAAVSSPWLPHNNAVRAFDAFAVATIVEDRDLNSPPGSCADGARYLVAGGATGLWATHSGQLALAVGANASNGWEFYTVAVEGMALFVRDELVLSRYRSAAWHDTVDGLSRLADMTDVDLTGLADSYTLRYDASNGLWYASADLNLHPTESFIIACSDESTALATGTSKVTLRMPYAFTLDRIRASLSTAQTSGSIFTVDVNESGSSLLSTKITIANGSKTSTAAGTQPVISDSSIADDAEVTVDIDQIGDGTAKGLKVTLIGHRT